MSAPEWISLFPYPWNPQLVPAPEYVGIGTAFPVETGWVGTHSLYWQPRRLTLSGSITWDAGVINLNEELGDVRCELARQLNLPKIAEVGAGEDDGEGTSWNVSYTRFPESLYLPGLHWLKQILGGGFQILSGQDSITTSNTGRAVGQVTVIANPGNSGVLRSWSIPVYALGPDVLVSAVNLGIGWEDHTQP